jgi:PAS domain S-box-containing protein
MPLNRSEFADLTRQELLTELRRARERVAGLREALGETFCETGVDDTRSLWDVADHLPVMLALVDHRQRYIYVNRTYSDWFGRMPEEMAGSKLSDVLSRQEYQEAVPHLQKALKGESVFFDAQRISGAGRVALLNIRYIPCLDRDGLPAVLFYGRDVTEERTREWDMGRWKRIFEQAAWGIALITPDGKRIQAVNPAYAGMHGYSMDELVGLPLTELYPAKQAQDLPKTVQAAIQRGRLTMPTYHKHRDGTVFPVFVDITAARNSRNELEYFIASVRDRSALHQYQRELEKSEDRLRRVVAGMPVLLDAFDEDGLILVWNRECERVTGYGAEEMIGNPKAIELLYPDPEYRQSVLRSLGGAQGDFQGREFVLTAKDGTPKTVAWTKLSSAYPIAGWAAWAIGLDITEQKQSQLALRQSEERYRAMFENLRSGVAVYEAVDGGRNFLFKEFNPAAEHINCKERSAVLGRLVTEVFPGIAKFGLLDVLRDVFENGGYRNHPVNKYEDGKVSFWAENQVYKLPTGEVVAVHDDITKRKRLEEALVLSKEKAEAASLAKNEFLATMSHEVRTPLNGIMGMLQLARTTPLNPEQMECITIALESSRKLTAILGDILDLSRIESGKLEIGREIFPFASLAESVTDIFQRTALQKNVEFLVDAGNVGDDDAGLYVYGDEGRVRQILFNLVGNALKFTEKGRVTLRIARLPHRRGQGYERLLFMIEDTGIGIPDEKLSEIFDIFTQADGTHTRKYGGVGLGLGIVRRLVHLMGGSLCLDSRVGEGTTAYLSLEFEVAPTPQHTRFEYAESDEAGSGRVLLVEDDRINRHALQRMLEKEGYGVHCVDNGSKAVDAVREQNFDFILMDIQMPEMDGLEATRRIRHLEERPPNDTAPGLVASSPMPIIALTAHAMKGDRERFIQAGMDEYLAKPVEFGELKRLLGRMQGVRAKPKGRE